MKYCLNISNSLTTNFRLQKDGKWQKCDSPTIISNNDYTIKEGYEIVRLQEKDKKIVIHGQEYEIEPDLGLTLGNFNQLTYDVYCFRNEYPEPPDFNQMKDTLLMGDDTRYNRLVLLIDGKFKLFGSAEFGDEVNPYVVMMHEGFIEGNGYVGKSLIDFSSLNGFLDVHFRMSLQYWIEHLKKKGMNYPSDYDEGTQSKELFEELEAVKSNWREYKGY